ncbi:RING-type domain-containing protein [Mycena venus]|uniref:RING-type domain-containing protein n=1 Tax=Mycena venus TaxID=2733690 RepID=A0A8H7D2L5_9AGAR|nr:RING-type domain-containing protein [Mycena venus]
MAPNLGFDTYDLLLVTDATASMGGYLDALRSSIPEILALAKLSGAFSRLGVLAYKDYTDAAEEIAAWSGWNSETLPQFVQNLEPSGGGDFPEAAKTALIRGLQAVNKQSRTLVLWYADAPPHHISVQSYENDVTEAKAFPPGAVDWVKLCHTARRRNCTVFSFTPNSMDVAHSAFYVLLSELTGGISISSKAGSKSSTLISRLTLGVILQWMGQGTSDMDHVISESAAVLLHYDQSPLTARPKPTDEAHGCAGYLPPSHRSGSTGVPLRQILSTPLDASKIPAVSFVAHSFDLAKRFDDASETEYRNLVYDSLINIIRSNVACLTYNPIFGQLWRAVCKDPSGRKTELIDLFSEFVGKVTEAEKKAALRRWLEESFDKTEEIEAIVMRHSADGSGPMVYLDLDADVQLTRTDLLEVSRSCYAGVVKKIATVFTHLKLIEPDVTLAPMQRSIPLALPPQDFFRILPHLIVPGTLYPVRAATLTAVISLITGVPFLKDSATALLKTAKGKWLDMQIPENISFDCARFLLSAPKGVVLTTREKQVYEAMRRYQLIELNLDAPIVVNVPWTPRKTRGPGDVKVQCKRCLVRRSITIMSHQVPDVCGLCLTGGLSPSKVATQYPEIDGEDSCWVECSKKSCRAQYVLEDVVGLKINPRCYYCRCGIPCPWLECSICLNRIIVPPRFRTAKEQKCYICPACSNAHWANKSIVVDKTTARILIAQNGVGWMGFAHKDIFEGKSAFKLMQAFGDSVFAKATSNADATLVLNNKRVHDPISIINQIENRVGRGEVVLSTCALCFEDMPSTKLFTACGRTGCSQLVDEGCLREWYGQNAPGKLLSMMQFACPFCRRKPIIKTLTRYNRETVALGGLQDAMDDRRFFYAWCMECGFAKQACERTSCTEAGVPPITEFRCKDCNTPTLVAEPVNEFALENIRWKRKKEAVWKDVSGLRIVLCPNPICQARINKTDGCNHMICICGTHFCYACGEEVPMGGMGMHFFLYHGSAYGD